MNRARCSAALYLICCTETYCSKYRKLRSSTQIIVMHRNARTHYNGIAMQATCEYRFLSGRRVDPQHTRISDEHRRERAREDIR